MDKGIIELIGIEEEEDCRFVWGVKYFFMGEKGKDVVKYIYCEFDMLFLLGISCGIILFVNYDYVRRVLY